MIIAIRLIILGVLAFCSTVSAAWQSDTTQSIDTCHVSQVDTIVAVELMPLCHDILIGDVDASGAVDIDDVWYLLKYIYEGGPPPLPERYSSVRQIYIRQVTFEAVIDVTSDSILSIQNLREMGSIHFMPQTDSAKGR